MALPPGQRAVEGFPRFGTHFNDPAPAVPANPHIDVGGDAVDAPLTVPVADLSRLPRREINADLHCVAGWSATNLRWEGVPFAAFYQQVIGPTAAVNHLVFEGRDGYRSFVALEDALADDVLLADKLDGRPLDGDHGAPVRLVSPSQYGYISVKHLCRIELRSGKPAGSYHSSLLRNSGLQLVKPHPRARVWHEERHRYLPAWAVLHAYRLLIPPIRGLSARGAQGRSDQP